MAKKSKPQQEFYEQLMAWTDRTIPALGNFDYRRFKKELRMLGSDIWGFIGAGLEDVGFVAAKAWHKIAALNHKRARRLIMLLGVVGIVTLFVVATLFISRTLGAYSADLNNPQALMNRNRQGTIITDRHGSVLYRTEGADNSIPVKFKAVPKELIDATLAAEDPDFYHHDGISIKGTARAVWADVTHGQKAEGGSTLAQQLVKTTLLSPEKSFTRKFKEMVLAVMLERHYTKDQVLELYFNGVYYGQGSRGAERAAETYFHKTLSNLSLGEEAMLAGLPLGPNRFDPNFDPAAAKARRDYILGRMADLKFITANEASAAKKEKLTVYPQQIEIKAPHFVFYVLQQLRDQYGEDFLERGGITVRTTLDLKKQQIGEQEVKDQISRLGYHHVTNAGLVALDPKTGDILAMVGSVDFNNRQFGKVNVTLAKLQPGSSFKPFVYATAFKEGYNGATLVQDRPMSVPDGSGQVYRPVNYDGKFRGPVLLRRALGNSFNIPALKVIQLAGIENTIKTATDLGITTLQDPSHYGISLALGSAEVRPLDEAAAYATFAEMGDKVTPKTILRIHDRYGKDITPVSTKATNGKSVLDPRVAYMIINILSDNSARLEEFGPNSPLVLSRQAFAKTGTTNDFRDNFTAGSTPNLTAVVWVGNNDHTPMIGINGITGAAPIWHNFMERSLVGMPVETFHQPDGLVTRTICRYDGGLAPRGLAELFLPDHQPTKTCGQILPKSKSKPSDKKAGAADNPADTTKKHHAH